MRDLCTFIGGLLLALLGALALIACLIFAGTYVIDRPACATYGEMTGRETRFDMISGCFVKQGDHFVPKEEINLRAITNEVPNGN